MLPGMRREMLECCGRWLRDEVGDGRLLYFRSKVCAEDEG